VLVEKEKKGHSYTSSRHPSLTEDKKAKIKAFTKEYTHKVLKKLKEKGKLRRPNGQDHSHGSGDPAASASSRHPNGNGFVYDNGSSPVTDTPSATPLSTSTPSAVLRTPNRRESAIAGELDDIFGVDPPEEDMHVDVDVKEEPFLPNLATPDQDRDQSPDVSALETGAAGTEKKMRRNSVVTKVQIGALGTPGTPTSGGPSPVDQV
jgi:histone-lysine N-methyltransferase SETD2